MTGGASGIGLAAARKLAEAGATVLICAETAGAAEKAADQLRADGVEIRAATADVTNSTAMAELVKRALDTAGRLDLLVCCAGIQAYGTVVETSEQEWDRVLAVNLKGVFLAARHAIPEMRRQGGAIVNIASVQAFATQRGVAAYAASKGAIVALTRAMAVDHAPDRIRVNAVCPGSVDTPMLHQAAEVRGGEGCRGRHPGLGWRSPAWSGRPAQRGGRAGGVPVQ